MNNKISYSQDVTSTVLAVLFIGILITASFWISRPFIVAFLWATIIVASTWPMLLTFQKKLWGRRGLAVALMTLLLLLVFIVPFFFAIATLIVKKAEITAEVKSLGTFTFPPPPLWVGSLPLLGPKVSASWQQLAAFSSTELSAHLAPYVGELVRWFVNQAGSIAQMMLNFLLTVIITVILYAKGETVVAGVESFARRLAGEKGEEVVVLAGKAIRGVALGVVVTALIQSAMGGIGLAITGVPGPGILTAVMFILCIAQIGPALVLIAAVIWSYYYAGAVWGSVLLVWAIPVMLLDNFLRPILIRKQADLPLLLIFMGVIGGLLSMGIIGLFIGPVVLAVTYTLLQAWVSADQEAGGASMKGAAGSREK
jgi:predicted PurR-regulated permease PerM